MQIRRLLRLTLESAAYSVREAETRSLGLNEVHMANLRKKVEATPERPQFLKTESGVGYRFAE